MCILLWVTTGFARFRSLSSYLPTFGRLDLPLIQGYEDAGDFTVMERLKTSIRVNLVFYLIVGSFGFLGLILLITMDKKWPEQGILGFAMGCSTTFGLVTGGFLLGFGLSEIPKSLWRNDDWTIHQKILSHKIAKMAVKLDDAHQDLSNAIVKRPGWNKGGKSRNMLFHWLEISMVQAQILSLASITTSFSCYKSHLEELFLYHTSRFVKIR